MKPRAIALAALCAFASVWIIHPAHTGSKLRTQTVVPASLSRPDIERATRSASRYRPEPEDLTTTTEPPTTTTTEPPTTTTTARPVVRTTTTTAEPAVSAAEAPTEAAEGSGDRAPCLAGRVSRAVAHACWDDLLAKYPWSQAKAFDVMYCESTGWAYNTNGRYKGLFQEDGGPMDPDANVASAYNDYFVPRGWQPWSCA